MNLQPTRNQELCAIIFCKLWMRMNTFIFEHIFNCYKQVIRSAVQQRWVFQQANLLALKFYGAQASQPLIEKRRWKTPNGLQLKTNWDVAPNSNTIYSSFRGLVRDSKGEILASFYYNYCTSLSPLVDEVMVLRKTLNVYQELGPSNVSFEGDCLQVI